MNSTKHDHIDWANSEISKGLPITMQRFAKAFDYFDLDDADLAFTRLLSSKQVPGGNRNAAMSNYKEWKNNNGSSYWADVIASTKTRVSKKRTVGVLVEGSEAIAKRLIKGDDKISMKTTPVYIPCQGEALKIAHKSRRGSNLLSTESGDPSFVAQASTQSDFKLYARNFLDGEGRADSKVHSHWVHNGTNIGAELMEFRDRMVQNNGGLTEAHQKLAVNFIFLVEEEYRTGGLEGEVEDGTWDAICDAVKDSVRPPPNEVVIEALEWFQKMANNKMEVFNQALEDSPPSDRNLRTVLRIASNSSRYWNTQKRSDDTYLESMLGPLLTVYFGNLEHAYSDWTPTQDDTKDPESSTLIPDYGTATLVRNRRYFVLLLEGKIGSSIGSHQLRDNLSKLGNEMKLALDSILRLEPSGEVSVVGILARGPLMEFFSMQICAEGTYVMHKIASAFIPTGATNAFPLLRLMEVCDHVKKRMEKCIHEIRLVKVRKSSNPKIPLSWLRPSFNEPRRQLNAD